MKYEFKEDEPETLQELARRYHDVATWVGLSDLPHTEQDNLDRKHRFIRRLENYGLIDFDTTDSFEIQPELALVVDKIDNPPVPNYWKELIRWWFASRWRAGVTAVAVLLPLLVQWVQMIQIVLSWVMGTGT